MNCPECGNDLINPNSDNPKYKGKTYYICPNLKDCYYPKLLFKE